jgi:hypothetical protein
MLNWLNKLIRGEIALGFFFSAIFWIVVLGWITSFNPSPEEKEACYQAASKSGRSTEECKTFWEKTTSDPIAFFTLVLAFSTIGMWLATIGLYRSNRLQIELARDEFISTHRPKIRIRHVRITNSVRAREQIVVRLVMTNVGISDAHIVSCGIAFCFLEPGQSLPPEDMIQHTIYRLAIPPVPSGLTWVLPDLTTPESLTPYGSLRIRARTIRLYCIGSVDYTDNRGRIRKSAFCRYLDVPDIIPLEGFWRLIREDHPDFEYED